MHPPIGGGFSTDFKSSNRIKISRLVQILLHFYWFRGGGIGGYLGCWGWCGGLLDNIGTMQGWQGWCGYDRNDRDNVGTIWGGDNGDHSYGGCGDHMGTLWELWGWCGDDRDDVGMTGATWGQQGWQGPCGDNKITKNVITFEQIEIIEFRLKIWDPHI